MHELVGPIISQHGESGSFKSFRCLRCLRDKKDEGPEVLGIADRSNVPRQLPVSMGLAVSTSLVSLLHFSNERQMRFHLGWY